MGAASAAADFFAAMRISIRREEGRLIGDASAYVLLSCWLTDQRVLG